MTWCGTRICAVCGHVIKYHSKKGWYHCLGRPGGQGKKLDHRATPEDSVMLRHTNVETTEKHYQEGRK